MKAPRMVGLVRVRALDVFRHDGRIVNVGDVLLLDRGEAKRLIAAALARDASTPPRDHYRQRLPVHLVDDFK